MICYERLYSLGVKVNCLLFFRKYTFNMRIDDGLKKYFTPERVDRWQVDASLVVRKYIYLVSFIETRPHSRGWPAAPKYILFWTRTYYMGGIFKLHTEHRRVEYSQNSCENKTFVYIIYYIIYTHRHTLHPFWNRPYDKFPVNTFSFYWIKD